MPNPAVIKAAVALLSDERTRKGIGWIIAAILSPAILLVALLCSMASGSSAHNTAVIELCFNGGAIPENMPAEYAACIKDMQDSFALLDGFIEEINAMTEEGNNLDGIRVKAVFFALYFGADRAVPTDHQIFVDCFAAYEERTRTIEVENEDGVVEEQEETYTAEIGRAHV